MIIELEGVAETLSNGDGLWRSCSGCHELNEGHDTGPYSETLKCHLGGGCSECGGIGAVWDTTDYQAMADEMGNDISAPIAAQPDKKFLSAVLDLCNNYGGPTADDCKGEYAWVGDIWRTAESMLSASIPERPQNRCGETCKDAGAVRHSTICLECKDKQEPEDARIQDKPVAWRWRIPRIGDDGSILGYSDWILGSKPDFLSRWPHEELTATPANACSIPKGFDTKSPWTPEQVRTYPSVAAGLLNRLGNTLEIAKRSIREKEGWQCK